MKGETAKTRFVILTSQRSGSTWLVSLLNQLNATTTYGELFLPRKHVENWDADFAYPRFEEARGQIAGMRPLKVFRYLDSIYQKRGAVGFKLMYAHLYRYPEILIYFWTHQVQVIHLVRKNALDFVISQALKRKIQKAHQLAGTPPLEDVQIELDPKTLIRRLQIRQRKIKRGQTILRFSGLRSIEIGYEDLQKDPSVFQSLCRFLSIDTDSVIPQSRFQKIRSKSQEQIIKNYAEVKRVLEGTHFVSYLE
ncbi:MAG TPA: sulfotransferase domain-containing protein [Anaerolineales bacterium]|nr:sulfotransferase domain-containing protein [Anaerolineales bacterium]